MFATDQSGTFFYLICISARFSLAVFVCGRTADCCRTLYMTSYVNKVYPLYSTVSTQFCPSVYEKKTVARGLQEYDYNMTQGVAVSSMNLKWKKSHISLFLQIPFLTYTNKSAPCSIMFTCSDDWWGLWCISIFFFFFLWIQNLGVTANASMRSKC